MSALDDRPPGGLVRIHRSAISVAILAVAAGAVPPGAWGQDSLASCAQVQDDTRRLACYDVLAGRSAGGAAPSVAAAPAAAPTDSAASAAVATTGAAAVAAVPAAAVPAAGPAAALDPVADFGLSAQALKERAPDDWVESITATVNSVTLNASNRFVITLHNGQVWTQNETDSWPVLKPGDTVTIKRAAMGSFMLTGPRAVSWRVRRVL